MRAADRVRSHSFFDSVGTFDAVGKRFFFVETS